MKLLTLLSIVVFSTGGYGQYNFSNPIPLITTMELLTGDQFGRVVSIWGDTCIVGATKRTTVNAVPDDEGVVFVFKREDDNMWIDSGITMSSKRSFDGFGDALCLYQGTAAIGAPKDRTYGTDTGSVHIFYSSTAAFSYSQEIFAPSPQIGDYFGYSVAIISGHTYYYDGGVVVGAYGHDYVYGAHNEMYTSDVGCVFVFANQGGTWTLVTTMQPSVATENANFGWSIDASSGAVAVGSPGSQAAYVFHLEPVQYECPHWGPVEDMPEACLDEHGNPYHRTLLRSSPNIQALALTQGSRRMEGGAPPGRHMYSVWEFIEVLHVQDDTDKYPGSGFGSKVAVCNITSPVLVVTAPDEKTLSSSGSSAVGGSVFVFTLFPPDDLPSDFEVPSAESHPDNHPYRLLSGGPGKARSRGGRSGGEGGVLSRRVQGGAPPGEDRKGHHNVWYFRTNEYTTDKDGYVWGESLEVTSHDHSYRYAQSVAVDNNRLLVGVLGGSSNRGRVDVYALNGSALSGVQTRSDLNEVRPTLPVKAGPLYGKSWYRIGTITDKCGGVGDRFGSSLGISRGVVIVGGPTTGLTSEYNIGTGKLVHAYSFPLRLGKISNVCLYYPGAAYVYNPFWQPTSLPAETKAETESPMLLQFRQLVTRYGALVPHPMMLGGILALLLLLFMIRKFVRACSCCYRDDYSGYEKALDHSVSTVSATSSHPLRPRDQAAHARSRGRGSCHIERYAEDYCDQEEEDYSDGESYDQKEESEYSDDCPDDAPEDCEKGRRGGSPETGASVRTFQRSKDRHRISSRSAIGKNRGALVDTERRPKVPKYRRHK